MDIFYVCVGVSGGMFWACVCVEVHFGWIGVGRHFLWVGESGWEWVEIYSG